MSIPGSATPLLLATTAAAAAPAAAFQVDRSLRFNEPDSAYLKRTPASASNRRTWTWSGWVKLTNSTEANIFTGGTNNQNDFAIRIENGMLSAQEYSGSWKWRVKTTALHRDFSAWYHFVVAFDSTQSTSSDRIKIYVNGVQQTSFSTGEYPSQNFESLVNKADPQYFGYSPAYSYSSFYLAETHFIDGQALAATDFGKYDSNNVWQPKEASFTSPNDGTTWSNSTVTTGTIDSSYPLTNAFNGSINQPNTRSSGANTTITITLTKAISFSSKVRIYQNQNGTANINSESTVSTSSGGGSWVTVFTGSGSLTSLTLTSTGGDTVSLMAIEVDGVILQDDVSKYGANGFRLNFSDNSSDSALGYDQSADTQGPSPDGGMDVVTYTGNGSTQTISGFGFQPDFVWIKNRGATGNHTFWDVARGANERLMSDTNDAESTRTGGLTEFTSDGFIHGNDGTGNTNNNTYVAWGWKAGGAASGNSDGSINSQTSVSTDYGFSIVTYTGNGSTGTVGHGLPSTPKWIVIKNRSAAASWFVYHVGISSGKGLNLNNTEAEFTPAQAGVTAVSDSTFSLGSQRGETNASGQNYVAYCWSEVSGFSKFGSYSGSSSDVTVTTGFKPRYILIKCTDTAGQEWIIKDSERGGDKYVQANDNSSEATGRNVTFNSDGFTLAHTQGPTNYNGRNYIYAAFADRPGNSFDVNNLVASTHTNGAGGFDVVTYTGSGSIQAIGAPVYSNQISGTQFSGSYSKDMAFDGDLDNRTFASVGTPNLVFTPSPPIAVSNSLRLRIKADSADNSGVLSVNGTDYSSSVQSGSNWLTIPNVSSLTEISFGKSTGNGHEMSSLAAIEVDGTILINGNGGDPLKFQPDLVWVKQRNATRFNVLFDSVRGNDKRLVINSTAGESTQTDHLYAFNSDGFTVQTSANVNTSSGSYVAWAWNAGANSNKTYTVKVVSDSGNKYRFDDFGTSAVTLDLQEGSTYVFDQSDSSNAGHPIRFGTSANGTDYTTGVTHTGTPGSAGAKTTLVLGTGVSTLYYSCANHSGMGGQINTNSNAGASNFDGSIQAVAKASNTYGFSIVTYTGTGSNATVGHGLSSAPKWIVVKDRSQATGWSIYHTAIGTSTNNYIELQSTGAAGQDNTAFQNTAPTNSVFSIGTKAAVNESGDNFVAYCWAEVPGFSKFGSYVGSGSTAKTITTGFKPSFVILRDTTQAANWVVLDSERGSSWIEADGTPAENSNSNQQITFGNDGFTVSGDKFSASGKNTIYMAFADTPDSSVIDSLIDTPTNYEATSGNNGGNYCTLNPLAVGSGTTLSNGNLDAVSGSSWSWAKGTIGVTSGKWYWEVTKTNAGADNLFTGIVKTTFSNLTFDMNHANASSNDVYGYTSYNGNKEGQGSSTSYGATFQTAGDVIGVALDMDAGTLTFYKNGATQGQAFSGITDEVCPAWGGTGSSISAANMNFGQRPFAISSIPTGYKSLCTQNLPDPTVADGSTAMDAKTYTGTGSTNAQTGLNFSPDFLWLKRRNGNNAHALFDQIRGVTKALESSNTGTEKTNDPAIASFDSNGFTVNGTYSQTNASSQSYIAWAWDAGTTTASNTDGGRTANVRANQSAGFSICSYTGGNGTSSFGHGLSAAPEFVVVKNRTQASQHWVIYHKYAGAEYFLKFTTDAKVDYPMWQDNHPTDSVVYLGNDDSTNNSGEDYIAYCFAPVTGYSAIGSYTGNGSTDGTFVHTGFRPKFLLVKGNANIDWIIEDSGRDTFNQMNGRLYPNDSVAESTSSNGNLDFLSNGFKPRTTHASLNSSGTTYYYVAFAEHPFKTARAR